MTISRDTYNSWVLQTHNRLRAGERPLFPGQTFESEPIPLGYAMDPAQFRHWQDRVIAAARACVPLPTPEEFLQGLTTQVEEVDPVVALTQHRLNQARQTAS